MVVEAARDDYHPWASPTERHDRSAAVGVVMNATDKNTVGQHQFLGFFLDGLEHPRRVAFNWRTTFLNVGKIGQEEARVAMHPHISGNIEAWLIFVGRSSARWVRYMTTWPGFGLRFGKVHDLTSKEV